MLLVMFNHARCLPSREETAMMQFATTGEKKRLKAFIKVVRVGNVFQMSTGVARCRRIPPLTFLSQSMARPTTRLARQHKSAMRRAPPAEKGGAGESAAVLGEGRQVVHAVPLFLGKRA